MTIHVFGATSSPRFSNYSLNKTSLILNTFVEVRPQSIISKLLRWLHAKVNKFWRRGSRVGKDAKSGGFNMTKFLTNSKQVLKAVPACDRRKIVVEYYFNNHTLSIEIVLVVLRNIEDVLTFKVNMEGKLKTKRGILSTLSSVYDTFRFAAPVILPGKILQHLREKDLTWDETVHNLFKINGVKMGKKYPANVRS